MRRSGCRTVRTGHDHKPCLLFIVPDGNDTNRGARCRWRRISLAPQAKDPGLTAFASSGQTRPASAEHVNLGLLPAENDHLWQ